MKRAAVVVVALAGVLCIGAVAAPGAALRVLNALVFNPMPDPCSVTISTENGANNAIQSAINANPGGTICVKADIVSSVNIPYPEQLTISTSGTTLKGVGVAGQLPIIEPGYNGIHPPTTNAVDWDSAPWATPATEGVPCGSSYCEPLAAIILVESTTPPPAVSPTTGVTLEYLTIDGTMGSSSIGCDQGFVGVDFQDASGTLTRAMVEGTATPSADSDCTGTSPAVYAYDGDLGAVYAYDGYFYSYPSPTATVTVTVSHTTVRNGYQVNGIACDDPGETCLLTLNSVTGGGPTTLNPQNGIQVANGSVATVSSNAISMNSYTGSGSTDDWFAETAEYVVAVPQTATGVLLFNPGQGSIVMSNTVKSNQMGIVYFDLGLYDNGAGTITISDNTVDTSSGYGIVANGANFGGDTVTIQSNTVKNQPVSGSSISGAPGILVDTGSFYLTDNRISGSSATGSNGASQIVCDPSGDYGYLGACASSITLMTAAIQGASNDPVNQTNMWLTGNVFTDDNIDLATVSWLGGGVNVVLY